MTVHLVQSGVAADTDADAVDPCAKLSPVEKQIAALHVEGLGADAIAVRVGRDRTNVFRALRRPRVRAAIATITADARDAVGRRVARLATTALDALEKIAADPSHPGQVAACKAILDRIPIEAPEREGLTGADAFIGLNRALGVTVSVVSAPAPTTTPPVLDTDGEDVDPSPKQESE